MDFDSILSLKEKNNGTTNNNGWPKFRVPLGDIIHTEKRTSSYISRNSLYDKKQKRLCINLLVEGGGMLKGRRLGEFRKE